MSQNPRVDVEVPAAHLERLPIFPLPRATLFPGVIVPLHLFEPRYRALAEHCVAGDRLLALAALEPGFEEDYHGRPPVHPVMGLGRIVAEQQLPDGRWNIALQGLCRVELLEERPAERPFREVRARRLDERERRSDRAAAERLRALVLQILMYVPAANAELGRFIGGAARPGQLADVVSGVFVEDPEARQRLLAELDVAARIALLEEALADVVLDLAMRQQGGDVA